MAAGGKDRASREARERARVYQARQAFHEGRSRRRRRDNLIAGIAGGVLLLAVLGVQTLYFTSGPGAPEPAPTATESPMPEPSDTTAPSPTESPESSESPTPTPTP